MTPAVVATTAVVEVRVAGVRNDRGTVHVEVCTRETFLKNCPYSGEGPARRGATVVLVGGVPPGRYAIQATHDENGNRKVDRGLFGIPKEGVGFSNDARIRMAPPRFEEAAFEHGPLPTRVSFHLRYFLR